MKLHEFNPVNTKSFSRKTDIPYCSINRKSGLFSLNKISCALIDLKAGDKVVIHQDEDDPECWYVEKRDNGYSLRPTKATTGVLFFNNCTLAKSILTSLGFTGQFGRLIIAGTPTVIPKARKLYGIINTNVK